MKPSPRSWFQRAGRSRAGSATALGLTVLVAGWLAAPPISHSQTGAAAPLSAEALGALLGQVRKQQDQLLDNQTKIETQTAALKEEIRQAKIYAARSGGTGRR